MRRCRHRRSCSIRRCCCCCCCCRWPRRARSARACPSRTGYIPAAASASPSWRRRCGSCGESPVLRAPPVPSSTASARAPSAQGAADEASRASVSRVRRFRANSGRFPSRRRMQRRRHRGSCRYPMPSARQQWSWRVSQRAGPRWWDLPYRGRRRSRTRSRRRATDVAMTIVAYFGALRSVWILSLSLSLSLAQIVYGLEMLAGL
mmetsp:Transcript_30489/g.73581  ORF Transcript_30489/g.73581 Transcript_30489/m.73581 type:complete len:205 (-) Transcript_30489:119-733(-)